MNRSLLLGAYLLAGASLLRADFSGSYDLGGSGSYNLVSGVSTGIGQWSGDLVTTGTGGSGSISVNGSDSFTIFAIGNAESGTGAASLTFASFSVAGPVSFSFSGSAITVKLDNVTIPASGSIYSFDVQAGQTLSIGVFAMGTTMMMMPGPPGPGYYDPVLMIWMPGPPTYIPYPGFATSATATITSFDGPISAIPEPASAASLAGAALLGFVACRRRRR